MNPKHPENEAQQMLEWFIQNILVLWQRDRCAVWSVFSLSSSPLVRESLCRYCHDLWEKEFVVLLYVYFLSIWLYFIIHLSCVLHPRLSLSLSVETHSSFNSFSPEENLMAQILLLMLVFIELYRRYFFSNLLRINKSLWNSIITFPLKMWFFNKLKC